MCRASKRMTGMQDGLFGGKGRNGGFARARGRTGVFTSMCVYVCVRGWGWWTV